MSKYIIIGADGFLGTELYKYLKDQGHFILGIGKTYQERENYYKVNFLDNNWRIVYEKILNRYNTLFDGVIFVAGIMTHDSICDLSFVEWNNTLMVNQSSFVFAIRDTLSNLSKNASIVAVASQNGVIGHENRISYGATKAAMIQLVKNIQVDLSNIDSNEIRVNAVSPGYIQRENMPESSAIKKLKSRTLTGTFVKADQIINVIYFLLNKQSSGIMGQNIIVDNGYTVI